MAVSSSLATEERMAWARRQLDEKGSVRIGPAAKKLGVSEMTVRRLLQELESLGMARRVRGGAVAVLPVAFQGRHAMQSKAKARIAAKARTLVPASGAIGIDASTTHIRLATAIDRARELLVITNGPETFAALQDKPGVTPILTGGSLYAGTGSLVGPTACHAAGSLLLNRLFLSAASFDPVVGSSETSVEEAEVKRSMVAVAAEIVLAVDSSKLGTRAIVPVLIPTQIDVLVTELEPDDDRLAPYRGLVEII